MSKKNKVISALKKSLKKLKSVQLVKEFKEDDKDYSIFALILKGKKSKIGKLVKPSEEEAAEKASKPKKKKDSSEKSEAKKKSKKEKKNSKTKDKPKEKKNKLKTTKEVSAEAKEKPAKEVKAQTPEPEEVAVQKNDIKEETKQETPVKPKTTRGRKPASGDNLKVIDGIGPKIESFLKEHGTDTYAKLAKANPDDIRSMLIAKGGTRYNANDPTYWPEQAALLAQNKMDELEALKARLKEAN